MYRFVFILLTLATYSCGSDTSTAKNTNNTQTNNPTNNTTNNQTNKGTTNQTISFMAKIVKPSDKEEFCSTDIIQFSADITYATEAKLPKPADRIQWLDNDIPFEKRPAFNTSLPLGDHAIELRVLDRHVSTINLKVIECTDTFPMVKITSPAMDMIKETKTSNAADKRDVDKKMYYNEITLDALISDVEDATIPDGKIIWTTDQTTLQDALLGTGKNPTVRLYLKNGVPGTLHVITLSVTDSDGNESTALRKYLVWTIL